MTEIKMTQKSGLAPLVVLGLAILALVIYLLFSYTTLKEMPVGRVDLGTLSLTNKKGNIKVNEFTAFASSDAEQISANPTYTIKALIELTEAINAVAAEHGFLMTADLSKVKADLIKVKENGDQVSKALTKNIETFEIRKAAQILSNEVIKLQRAGFPTLAAEGVKLQKCAALINPYAPIPEQRITLKAYFKQADSLLQKMN